MILRSRAVTIAPPLVDRAVRESKSGSTWNARTALIALVCLLVWVGSVPMSLRRPAAYFDGETFDQSVYADCAVGIVSGRGFMHRTFAGVDPPIFSPLSLWQPGYPVLIAAVHAFGIPAERAGIIVSLVAGGAFVFLCASICVRLFHWTVALGLTLTATCMPLFVQFSTYGMSEVSYMAFSAAALVCLMSWMDRDQGGWLALFAGGFFAATAWSMHNLGISLLVSTGLFVIVFSCFRRRSVALKCSMLWLAGASLVVVPVIGRNVFVFGALSSYTLPPAGLSLMQSIRDAAPKIILDLGGFGNGNLASTVDDRMAVAILAVALLTMAAVAALRYHQGRKVDSLDKFEHVLLLGLYAGALIGVVILAHKRYFSVYIEARRFLPVYWIIFICAIAVGSELLIALRLSFDRRTKLLASACCVLALQQMRAQIHRFGRAPMERTPAQIALVGTLGSYLKSAVGEDRIVLAYRSDLLTFQGINARNISIAPFVESSVDFRVISREDVRRAGDSGILWGLVIDDLARARAGTFGPWLQQLAAEPAKFAELQRLPFDPSVMVFRYLGAPGQSSAAIHN